MSERAPLFGNSDDSPGGLGRSIFPNFSVNVPLPPSTSLPNAPAPAPAPANAPAPARKR